MKRPLSNHRLSYLDDILKELAKEKGHFVSEDIIAPKVCYYIAELKFLVKVSMTKPNIPKGRERMLFRTATIYLEKIGLITRINTNPYVPDFMISFEGLELIENGGLLRQRNKEIVKYYVQLSVWILAFIAFGVNTYFQITNYRSDVKKETYVLSTQSKQLKEPQPSLKEKAVEKTKVSPK